MKHSHPNRWAYGGILIRTTWDGGPVDLETPIYTIEHVAPGDRLLMLRTAANIQLVAVLEHAPKEVTA